MTMTLIDHTTDYTPELHNMLDAVRKGNVVHHSGTCAFPRGWSWSTGGHMNEETQRWVDILWDRKLILWDLPPNPCGNTAKLTFDGSARLAEWDAAWPVGGAA